MKDIMIDIETMGTKPGCSIVSIGAVQFDIATGEIGKTFYCNIDLESCQQAGLKIEASTVWWWLSQNKAAQESLNNNRDLLEDALLKFEKWFESINDNNVQVWANSPSFDLSVLEAAFNIVGRKQPWFYWKERDCRTLVSFAPHIRKSMINDLPHDAMHDCLFQIRYCTEIYKTLNR
jgi:DNA polymerase III epsilon subunit-like protein